ncbi:FAD-dependent oxidoreductase [Aeromicrobium sp.]|uniref:FAD-dependent oxidoreductase n=1 Tax=Aeromicrobium sp. TaxID=1871063 RepID=UPI0030C498DC
MHLPSVIVVGGGAMGSSAARELARSGHAVTVLEQHDRLHHHGSSHGTSRIMRFVYDDPFYVRLAVEARPLWDELQLTTDLELLRITGGVDHGPRRLLEPFAAALDEVGLSYEWLLPGEAARRWPGMRFDEAVLFQPDAGVTHPDNTMVALQRDAESHGAQWHTQTRVVRIEETPDGVTVAAADRVFTADQVVLTTGVWTSLLATLPVEAATQVQPAHFVAIEPGSAWPTFIHRRADGSGRPIPEAYGLPSPEGVKVGFHGGGKPVDPDDRDFAVVAQELEDLRAYATDWLPGVDPASLDAGTCLYGGLAEDDFLIDRSGRVTVAIGFSGHGFKFVPLVGRMVAGLVAGTARPEPRFTISAHRPTV